MSPRPIRRRRGAMLMELIVSSASVGMIVLGLHAAIAVSLKSVPTSDSPAQLALEARQVVDRLAAEFETAVFVYEHTSTSLGMTVADRDGDGVGERIRYAWTGAPGGPLTRQYNNESPAALAGEVQDFSLTDAYAVVSEPYPAVCVEDASESLLVDNYSSSGVSDVTISSSNWYGQHFAAALPANAYAWRPTRVQFLAKKSGGFFGFCWVQFRRATAGVTPSATVLQQWLVADEAWPGNYEWQQFSISDANPLPAGGAICLVLQHHFGSSSVRLQNRSGSPGRLRSTNGGMSWSYDAANTLNSRLYGKRFVSSGTWYASSKFLTSLNVALQLQSTSPAIKTACTALNHPELCTGLWELKFDGNPTTVDVNGDGAGDWATSDGATFSMNSISNGVWTTSASGLKTSPNSDFNAVTVVDLRCRNVTVGGQGATFTINAFRSGSTLATLETSLALQGDGTQTLTISQKTSDLTRATILSLVGLPSQMTDLRLIFDRATSSVNLRVNGVQRGTYALTRFASSDGAKCAAIGAAGSQAEYAYVRIRNLEP